MDIIRYRCCADMLSVPGIVRVYCTDYFRAVPILLGTSNDGLPCCNFSMEYSILRMLYEGTVTCLLVLSPRPSDHRRPLHHQITQMAQDLNSSSQASCSTSVLTHPVDWKHDAMEQQRRRKEAASLFCSTGTLEGTGHTWPRDILYHTR